MRTPACSESDLAGTLILAGGRPCGVGSGTAAAGAGADASAPDVRLETDVRTAAHDGTPGAAVDEVIVLVDDGRPVWWGPSERVPARWRSRARAAESDPSLLLTPTLMDHHVHGGGGVDLATSPTVDVSAWLAGLRAAGVEHVIGSLPSLPLKDTAAAVERLEPLSRSGHLAGLHLEGPFLSPARAGAHPGDALLVPDSPPGRRYRDWLLALPRGLVATMTYAPELPGAAALASELVGHGVTPCPGHSDADLATMAEALAPVGAGPDGTSVTTAAARQHQPVVTHLFNAMRGFHHRDPGPVPAALDAARRGRARLELIADGHHVDDALVRMLLEDRSLTGALCLVSDAVAATGPGPDTCAGHGGQAARGAHQGGEHDEERSSVPPLRLGRAVLDVYDGVPCLARSGGGTDSPTLAGGAADLPAQFLRLLRSGAPVEAVVPAVTSVPRRTLPADRRTGHGWVLWRR